MAVKRVFSLNGNDFYPLIHIHAKYMSYDEKVAYRARHGIPDTIDRWIADGKTCTKAPTADPHRRGPSLECLFWQDVVECIFNVICEKGLVKGGVQDPDEFTLTLRLRVPPTTSFLMYYWQSPTVVVDQYIGEFRDKFSPEWLETVQTECRFWQSRTLMLEMILNFVHNIPLNSKVSTRVRSWCRAMSIPASSLSTFIHPRPSFYPFSPRNTHRHKLDLSAEESQELRKAINEGSPSRRRKEIFLP